MTHLVSDASTSYHVTSSGQGPAYEFTEVPVIQAAVGIYTGGKGLGRFTRFGKYKPPMLVRGGNRIVSRRSARFLRKHKLKIGLGGLLAYGVSQLSSPGKFPKTRRGRFRFFGGRNGKRKSYYDRSRGKRSRNACHCCCR